MYICIYVYNVYNINKNLIKSVNKYDNDKKWYQSKIH